MTSGGLTLGFENARDRERRFFGRLCSNFQDRYFLTVGARVDGNIAFGEDWIADLSEGEVSPGHTDESSSRRASRRIACCNRTGWPGAGAFEQAYLAPASWGSTPGLSRATSATRISAPSALPRSNRVRRRLLNNRNRTSSRVSQEDERRALLARQIPRWGS